MHPKDLYRGLKPDESTYPSPQVTLDRIFKYHSEKSNEDWSDFVVDKVLQKMGVRSS